MVLEVKEIALREGYVEATLEGAADRAPYNYDVVYGAIATACGGCNCPQVLIDRTAVKGEATGMLQQVAGEYIASTFPYGARIALLVSESLPPYRLEAAAAGRGKTLRIFWGRDKALKWLLKN